MRFGDAHAADFALARRRALEIVDQRHAVDLRRLPGHARLPQQFGFARFAFHQHPDFPPHQSAAAGPRDAPLQGHQPPQAALNGAAVHFAVQRVAGAGVFVRVREDAQVVEARGANELAQLLEIRRRLAREPHDEAGADGPARTDAPDAFDQFEEDVGRPAALHAPQHARARVLQRHVDILHQRLVRGDGVQQPPGHLVGVRVQEADPLFTAGLDLRQARQKPRQAVGDPQVLAIAGGVLPDQVDFAHALREQTRGFGNHAFEEYLYSR